MSLDASKTPGPATAPPMNAWFYMLGFLPGAIVFGLFARSIQLPLEFVPQIPIIIILATFCYSAWKTLHKREGRPAPLVAALPLFVPILNIFWIYFAVYPMGKAIKEDAEDLNLNVEIGDSFSRAFCHLQFATIAAFVLAFLLTFMDIGSLTGLTAPTIVAIIVAGLILVLWLVDAYVMFYHYSHVINLIASHRLSQETTLGDGYTS